MTATPTISVIIPVYNGAHFLEDAVSSILTQAHRPLEIIVVDDGSTDAIDAVVTSLPVTVRFERQQNSGPSAARNLGISVATGSMLAFLDVDDLWPEGRLAMLLDQMLANPYIDVARGRAQMMKRDSASSPFEPVGDPADSFPNYIGAGLFRRSAFETVGTFDEMMKYAEDTDWFMRADAAGINVLQLSDVTLQVRRHETNMTRGQSAETLNPLRLFKKQLDRMRAQENATSQKTTET
jgi:glycosyltransferase involved in cell wall biosynthesis